MSELPHTWAIAAIGEVSVDCAQKIPRADEAFQYIDISSVDRRTKTIVGPQQLHGRDAPSRARKHVRSGDVLVSMTRPNLNAVAMVPDSLDGQIASTGFDVLRPISIDPRWLFYLVRTRGFIDRMSELVQGALYPAVRSKDVRGYEAPVAPINEQKRIVEKLDAVLVRVDACRDRLDRVPAILERYRQSVLAAAASGKLRVGDVPNMWTIRALEELFEPGRKCAYGVLKPGPHYEGGVRLLKSGQVRDGSLDLTDDFRISPALAAEFKRTTLRGGEVLLNLVGASIGRAAVAPDFLAGANVSRAIAVLPVAPHLAKWVQLCLLSEYCQTQIFKDVGGSAQPVLNLSVVRAIQIPCPPDNVREALVYKVESLLLAADRLAARYHASRAQFDSLLPALLAKAFRGGLIPQDPGDEPASLLLERLRMESISRTELQRRSKMTTRRPPAVARKVSPLLKVLSAAGKPLTPEELFARSGRDPDVIEEVEEFFGELRELMATNELKETRPTKSAVLLSAKH